MLKVGLFGEEQVVGDEAGFAALESLVPLIVLFVLNLEAGLDPLGLLVRDYLGVFETGVFGDELLLLQILRFAASHTLSY